MICVSLARGRHRYLLSELRHLGQQGVGSRRIAFGLYSKQGAGKTSSG